MTDLGSDKGYNAEAGFTLLELLVAITLLGFLSVLLYSGLHLGQRVWETSEKASTKTNKIRLFQESLRQELVRAYPLMSHSPIHPHIAFAGDADHLTFLSQNVSGVPAGEMAYVTLQISSDRNETTIMTTVLPELATKQHQRVTAFQVAGTHGMNISYYGADKPGTVPKWQKSWYHPSRLPKLVRIRASSVTASTPWPDLVVQPRIEADMSCTYDLLTQFCQGR